MAKRQNYSIGAMDIYQNISGYGKNAEADKVTVATTLESATITAIGAGKQLKAGDIMFIFSAITTPDGADSTLGNTLIFDVTYYISKRYFNKKTVTVTFTAGTMVDDINAQLLTDGLSNMVVASLVGTKLRIQATGVGIGIKVIGGTDLVGLGLTTETYAIPLIFKVGLDVTTIATTVALSEYYSYGFEKYDTSASLTDLEYKCFRFFGQSSGATLSASLTADTYKGSSKVAIQTEYNAGDSSLAVTDMVFNTDNLEFIKGLTKRTVGRTFFSGKSCDVTYKYGSYSNPLEFELFGVERKTDGVGMILVEAERAIDPSLTITLGKSFRVMSETITLLANTDRVICKVFEL